jgi:hypothetical protein
MPLSYADMMIIALTSDQMRRLGTGPPVPRYMLRGNAIALLKEVDALLVALGYVHVIC